MKNLQHTEPRESEIQTPEKELESLQQLVEKLRSENEELRNEVSDRKKIEEALRESEQKLKYHFENSPLAVVEWDMEYVVTAWSKEAEHIFGWKASDTLGVRIDKLNLIHPDDLPIVENTMERLSSGKETTVVSCNRNIKKDNSMIECIWYNSVLLNKEGEMASVMSLVDDVTDRNRTMNNLKEARKRLDIALENANIGIWEWNLQTGKVTWDTRHEKIFGLQPGEFNGTRSHFESLIHEEDVEHVNEALKTALASDKPLSAIYRVKFKNGTVSHISSRGFVERDKNRVPVSISGVSFDITDMKRGNEQAILQLNDELLRSNSDLQQFAYIASHDLQEPLRMVSSFTQLLQKRYQDKLDGDANEYIKYAVEGSERMFNLINGLLSYSRIQTRAKEFVKVDMNFVLDRVKANLRILIEKTGAVINSSILPEPFADDNQMIQLMQNLIENGIKFSKNPPVINIGSSQEGGYYLLYVQDHGIGIEPQYFDRIFKIFQRLHAREEYEGTGIGLSVCKRIVERHGGDIWVESEPEKGSTFYFRLPVLKSY